jgi:hypothetical protein
MYGADELRRRGTPSELGYSRNKSASYKLSAHSFSSGHKTRQPKRDERAKAIRKFMPILSSTTSHSNSASGLPGGPKRPDGETGAEISAMGKETGDEARRKSGTWETDSTGSQVKIVKTTVVSAAWEEVEA